MMTPERYPPWYAAFCRVYLDTFGLHDPTETAAMQHWWTGFKLLDVTANELEQARREVMSRKTAPFRLQDHYYAIKLAITEARTKIENERQNEIEEQLRKQEEEGKQPDVRCKDCCGTGYASVPHPRFCDGNQWRPAHNNAYGDPVYVRAMVTCNCEKGLRIAARQKALANGDPGGKKPKIKVCMTLDNYENQVNGQWRTHVREVTERLQALRSFERAQGETGIVPVKQAVKTLADSTKMPAKTKKAK